MKPVCDIALCTTEGKNFNVKQLELDTFEGQAWIGVVPFTMDGIRIRGLPLIPFASAFAEINVRTYVKVGNKTGVFFFSLDAAHRPAVVAARTFFHLPYYYATIDSDKTDDQTIRYSSERKDERGNTARFAAEYRPVSEVFHAERGTFDYWLSERYCLYTMDRRGDLLRGDIHHEPWPLQRAEAEISMNTMIEAAGPAQPAGAPVLHYAERLQVLLWRLIDAKK